MENGSTDQDCKKIIKKLVIKVRKNDKKIGFKK